jgi:hypothetical protein
MKQNPFACPSNSCVLRLPNVSITDYHGTCECLDNLSLHLEAEISNLINRNTVRQGIRWLIARSQQYEQATEAAYDIINTHLEGETVWLEQVRALNDA